MRSLWLATLRTCVVPCLVSLAALASCGDSSKDEAPSFDCDAEEKIDGRCVGARIETLCASGPCTTGSECVSVKSVSDQPSLSAALAAAAPDSCVALAPGSYETADVPTGVKLLGPGYGKASVGTINVKLHATPTTAPAVIRGVTANFVALYTDAQPIAAQVDQSVIRNGAKAGSSATAPVAAIAVGAGNSLTISDSTIEQSTGYGLLATDALMVKLSRTLVRSNIKTGVWLQCTAQCQCATSVEAAVESSVVRSSGQYGVTMLGVKGSITSSSIRESRVPDGVVGGGSKSEGAGLIVAACSDLTATKLGVQKNTNLGLFVSNAKALVGDPNAVAGEHGIIIQGNGNYGAWLQDIDETLGQSAALHGALIDQNSMVGLGISGASRGIIIQGTQISNTSIGSNNVNASGNPEKIADGICWRDGAQAALDAVTFAGNERMNLLLNQDAGDGSQVSGIIIQGSPGTAGSIIIQGVNDPTKGVPTGLDALSPKIVPLNTFALAPSPAKFAP